MMLQYIVTKLQDNKIVLMFGKAVITIGELLPRILDSSVSSAINNLDIYHLWCLSNHKVLLGILPWL